MIKERKRRRQFVKERAIKKAKEKAIRAREEKDTPEKAYERAMTGV